tara:strand:- start:4981 stop:5553 length:573 start_codon:yes stop_codon:yes gene_type:complete
MIYIIDNFVDKDIFLQACNYLNKGDFEKVESGGKNFYIKSSPEVFNKYIINKLITIEHQEIENILSFFRVSTNELDTTWRIHSDLNIKGQKPDRALVLYMSPRYKEDLHGTALWEHEVYGKTLPQDISDEKYNEMIQVDAENLDMWRLSSVVGYEQNRLVSYPSSYFHSKYPNKSWKKGRQVFVMFYKYK